MSILFLNMVPEVRNLVVDSSLLLFLLVVVSGTIFATIPCTKVLGFLLSLICFIEIFILAILQDNFCLSINSCPDIKVSLAILLVFLTGLICYFITVSCFCCARDFERQVYKGQWKGEESVNMYMPNRTFCEFILIRKSNKTQK